MSNERSERQCTVMEGMALGIKKARKGGEKFRSFHGLPMLEVSELTEITTTRAMPSVFTFQASEDEVRFSYPDLA